MTEQAFKVNALDIETVELRDDSGNLSVNGVQVATMNDIALSDYSKLVFESSTYNRQATQFSIDGDTVFSGNAVFNEGSNYYYFVKEGDVESAVIFSELDNDWFSLVKTGFDFTAITDNEAVGNPNSASNYGSTSTQYENGVNQPTASATFSYDGGDNAIAQALAGKENLIAQGTTSQFFRGDKTFVAITAADVGLGNVDNTSDVNKPVSVPQQQALDNKADVSTLSSNLTGEGASIVGIEDGEGRYNATNVEDALEEVKALADQNSLGLGAFWQQVQTASDVNIDISLPTDSVGGYTLTNSGVDRVLLTAQSNNTDNGIYIWNGASTPMTRSTDADQSDDFIVNKTVFIVNGDNAGVTDAYNGTSSPVIGTDPITFTEKSSSTLADGSVTTAKIADESVTKAKLSQEVKDGLLATVVNSSAGATEFTLTDVLVDNVDFSEFNVIAVDGANKTSIKIISQHNGTNVADATAVEYTTYAQVGSGNVSGFTVLTDLDGTGETQTMRLRCKSDADVVWKCTVTKI